MAGPNRTKISELRQAADTKIWSGEVSCHCERFLIPVFEFALAIIGVRPAGEARTEPGPLVPVDCERLAGQIESIEDLWFALEAKLLASILCQLLYLTKLLVISSRLNTWASVGKRNSRQVVLMSLWAW